MTIRDLLMRLRALVFPRRVERELDEELAFHLERETHEQIARGVDPVVARRRAQARFGSVPLAADECRDARGTAAVESFVRDVLFAFRSFRRAPLVALTIVATVALGLGLVTLVFTFYNLFFLRIDAVRNPGELFAVEQPSAPGSEATVPFTRTEYESMRRETSVFTDVVAAIRPVRARVDGRSANFALVTGNFFSVLGVSAAMGRPLAPDDDGPAPRPVIVLSHHGWHKLFNGDPAVIGRTTRINGMPYDVVGVMPESVRGLSILPPDYWAPLGLAGRFRAPDAGGGDFEVQIIGRLKQGISPEAAAWSLTTWASQRRGGTPVQGRPAVLTLEPRQGTEYAEVTEVIAVFMPIFFAFGLILMIGCANVANLQLARGVARQREIGVQLSLGASRRRVIRQLLTESLILAVAAAVCALGVARGAQHAVIYAITATLPPELGQFSFDMPPADWRVVVFVFAGAVVATLCFGLAPALQSTRLDLVRSMRGEVMRDARPGRARRALIGLQVGASALLLVCAGVLLRSAAAAANVESGVRTRDTLMAFVTNEPRRLALLQAISNHPLVTAIGASSRPVGAAARTLADAPGDAARRGEVYRIAASPGYFDVIGLALVRGRAFTNAEGATESSVAIVTERLARDFWPAGNALGRQLRLEASDAPDAAPVPSRTLTVVGVARDVKGPLASDFFPLRSVYVPTSSQAARTNLILQVRGDPERARQVLLDDLTRVDPWLGEVNTMRTLARLQSYVLSIAFWVAMVLGGLALLLTVSGLFSVLSYLVEQRAKDIGVHAALGATSRDTARLVLSELARPVGLGLSGGVGLAAAAATLLMAASDAEVGQVIRVFDPAAYTTSVAIIVASCALAATVPALRASRIDPVVTLRQD